MHVDNRLLVRRTKYCVSWQVGCKSCISGIELLHVSSIHTTVINYHSSKLIDLEKSDVRNRDVQNRFYSCKTGKSKTEVEEVGVGWGGAWWRVVVYM